MNETKQAEAMMKAIAAAGYNAGYRKGCRDMMFGMLIGAGVVTVTIAFAVVKELKSLKEDDEIHYKKFQKKGA